MARDIDWDGRWLASLAAKFPHRLPMWRGWLRDAGADEALVEDRLIEVAAWTFALRWGPEQSPEFIHDLAVSAMCEVLRGDQRGRDAAALRLLTTQH